MVTRRGAAFFDLDRTLLSGASGEVFSGAMRAAGLITRSVPGERLIYGIFNAVGENVPSMALARQGARFAKGRSQHAMQAAAAVAAETLETMMRPLAADVFAEHRNAGRPVVLATTTPYDLVRPLAERLGLDDVIATRYGVTDDGTYDGTIDGPFVWAMGKLSAVRAWATDNGIDLAASYAYSDSVYDSPLLAAVGNPFVVNPDPRLRLMAAAQRWPTLDLGRPAPSAAEEGSARMPALGAQLQRAAMSLSQPMVMFPYARFDIRGTRKIPREGPVILVGNHRSYFDSAAVAMTVARTGRNVRFLGKKEVFDVPVIGRLTALTGGIRVDRGTGSDVPLKAAAAALEAGDMVVLMPQGTIPRGRAFFEPELKGRWGAARLAAMTRAPVIPIGMWGTDQVWPRSARLPNVLNVASPPTVRVRVGAPVELKYRSPDADTKRIMQAIAALLPADARASREPTEEELVRTFPPGYKGDPNAESERRPGTD